MEDQNILIEKQNKRIDNNRNQLEDQNKLIEIQNVEMENLKNQTSCENQENKKLSKEITDLKQQVGNLNEKLKRKIDNQRENQKDEMKKLSQSLNNMIMLNVNEADLNFTPVSTAFQWKINIEADNFSLFSPPFYNIVNGMCFQLQTFLYKKLLYITLRRYRGKYDHPTNHIPTTTKLVELALNMFGNNGNDRVVTFSNPPDGAMSIGRYEKCSKVLWVKFSELPNSIIDSYLHMHLIFNNK